MCKCRKNSYNLSGEYGIGYTTKGERFYFDLEDYDKIKEFNWSKAGAGYFRAWSKETNKIVYLHRIILELNDDIKLEVDHINHDIRDNRKSNLRICSKSQNSMNKGLRSDNVTKTTGVRWNKNRNKWESYIMVNQKNIYLGLYTDKNDAIKVRKEAEEKYFGEYAYRKED